jgi:hypothetical protein
VSTRGCQLERAAHPLLAANVRKVGQRRLRRAAVLSLLVWGWITLAPQIRHRLREVPQRDRLDPGERRLGRALGGAEKALQSGPTGSLRRREHAPDRPQAPVERELADSRVSGQAVGRHLARRGKHRKRNREVEA